MVCEGMRCGDQCCGEDDSKVMDDIMAMQFENSGSKLHSLLMRYHGFRSSWLESVNEPSKIVALIMKYMSKY
jgi:hypothetical protein